jgi:hypothetical protein
MDPMEKMWLSFIAIGLMILASGVVTFARIKTKGIIKWLLIIVAVIMLFYGVVLGLLSIL